MTDVQDLQYNLLIHTHTKTSISEVVRLCDSGIVLEDKEHHYEIDVEPIFSTCEQLLMQQMMKIPPNCRAAALTEFQDAKVHLDAVKHLLMPKYHQSIHTACRQLLNMFHQSLPSECISFTLLSESTMQSWINKYHDYLVPPECFRHGEYRMLLGYHGGDDASKPCVYLEAMLQSDKINKIMSQRILCLNAFLLSNHVSHGSDMYYIFDSLSSSATDDDDASIVLCISKTEPDASECRDELNVCHTHHIHHVMCRLLSRSTHCSNCSNYLIVIIVISHVFRAP